MRKNIAPTLSNILNARGSVSLNLRIVMLRAANVPGRTALAMGSTNFSDSPLIFCTRIASYCVRVPFITILI